MHSHSAGPAGDFRPSEVAVFYAARVPGLNQGGREWRGACPRHKGTHDNFSVNAETGVWFCHSQCDCGGDIIYLEMALTGADFKAAKEQVYQIVGRPEETGTS